MEVVRPTADFKPSVWGDFFLHYSPSLSMGQMSAIEQRIKELKKEVMTMFSTNDLAEKLTLVDDLHRLGVYYHFEDEIREVIRCINDHVDDDIGDIRSVALRFRLLRQEGYAVSPGVFSKFRDSEGKFKQEVSYDVEGLIQLYEASMLGTNDEPILEEAMEFARGHMERMKGEEPHTAQIRRALEIPFHRGMRRLRQGSTSPCMQRVRLATQFCWSSPSLISIICNQSTRPRSRVSPCTFLYQLYLVLVSLTHPWYSQSIDIDINIFILSLKILDNYTQNELWIKETSITLLCTLMSTT